MWLVLQLQQAVELNDLMHDIYTRISSYQQLLFILIFTMQSLLQMETLCIEQKREELEDLSHTMAMLKRVSTAQ